MSQGLPLIVLQVLLDDEWVVVSNDHSALATTSPSQAEQWLDGWSRRYPDHHYRLRTYEAK